VSRDELGTHHLVGPKSNIFSFLIPIDSKPVPLCWATPGEALSGGAVTRGDSNAALNYEIATNIPLMKAAQEGKLLD
jgi:hypothetical protein